MAEPQTQLLSITRIFRYAFVCLNINLKYCRRCNQVRQLLVELDGCSWEVLVGACSVVQLGHMAVKTD